MRANEKAGKQICFHDIRPYVLEQVSAMLVYWVHRRLDAHTHLKDLVSDNSRFTMQSEF